LGTLAVVLWSAAGGALVELIALWREFVNWRDELRAARSAGVEPPQFRDRMDATPITVVAVAFRLVMGAFAGFLARDQITGEFAAIAVGAAAPAILYNVALNNRVLSIVADRVVSPGNLIEAPAGEQ
jgi:hypothetical protein